MIKRYAKKGCKLSSAKLVLKSFVGDKDIPDYEQRSALESLGEVIKQDDKQTKDKLKNFFWEIFKKSKNDSLKNIANNILITIYKDEKAIDWRFKKIKERKLKSNRPEKLEGGVITYWSSLDDEELDTLSFAKPLIELKDEKYLSKFLDLLDHSFEPEFKDKKYWEYVNYLWRIVISFVDSLKEKSSFKPLLKLEEWISNHSHYENINWLIVRTEKLRRTYIDSIGKKFINP